MGKSNKKKITKNESIPKIEEPVFEEEKKIAAPGDKKLLAQLEKQRKDEEAEKLIKQTEAEKKKKNNKISKPKQTQKNKNEIKTEDVTTTSISKPNKIDEISTNQKEVPKLETTFTESKNDVSTSSPSISTKYEPTQYRVNTSSPSISTKYEPTQYRANTSSPSISTKYEPTRYSSEENWRTNRRNENVAKPNYSNDGYNSSRKSFVYNLSGGKNDEKFQKFLKSDLKSYGKVREENGDLFNAPNDFSLAHCVAEDFSMGAGIAKEFKIRFKSVSKLLNQNEKSGGLAILQVENRFIYYLVTKTVSRGKPTLYTLWQSLIKLKDHMTENNVTKLAIPQIGCGLDRLDWDQVKGMLEYIFKDNDVEIVVYVLGFDEELPTPTKILRKCFVVHKVLPLIDIDSQTGLIFLGTEDSAVSHEMQCLAEKFDFIKEYQRNKKSTGDVIKIVDKNEYLYGLIIRRSINNKISFSDFEKCLFNLQKMLKADVTRYIALQAFLEKDDEIITEKLVNLMQYTLRDVEIWVCWPKELENFCPPQK